MKNKKLILILIIAVIVVILFFIIFRILYYKNTKVGNNISDKTLQEVEAYILNISSYKAKIEVTVESNKNTNKYVLEQKYTKPNIASQKVIEPKNIEGLTIKYDGANLQISNSNLNLNTIYENYQYIADNVLWFSDFIENYKNSNGTITEENDVIVMEVKCDKNIYNVHEKLYIDRKTSKITKLLVEDENKKSKIYITYNEIEIGSLNKENVLAFKQEKVRPNDI